MISSKLSRGLIQAGKIAVAPQSVALIHSEAILKPHQKTLLEPSIVKGLLYRVANEADRELVRDGLNKYFYPEDPVTSTHYSGKEPTTDDTEGTLEMVNSGCMILAMDEQSGRLAGFSGSTIVSPDEPQKLLEKASIAQTKKYGDVLRLTAHLTAKTRVCERFGVDQAYHLDMVGVNPNFRGKSIGEILQEKHMELACAKGLRVLSAYVTGPYSARICERLGMQCVYTLPYRDYRDESGRVVFRGTELYTVLKCFVMKI
ncbi:arylalkylamine N-acetyltransferase-like 2 [Uranotaenia lowii]|uniref:arylalkylamine N-acetyltransferase-like 2 n=1 Tax=Uranotaenia lowii TaxID=190385 RepID=UPI00247A31DC|nr:arylalkylamine N-acetyltransferase-like 2 [Uranotaenia lowii]